MKIFCSLIVGLMLLMNTAVTGATRYGESDPAMLADMYKNPARYIHIGSDNFGLSFYLDKTTIESHEYAPPIYIIAFKPVYHLLSESPGKKGADEYAGYNGGIRRYKYDYSSRKMYIEEQDSNGSSYWKNISPLTKEQISHMNGGEIRYHSKLITAGEIAFYLVYGISFFEQPTYGAANFINLGISSMIPLLHSTLPKFEGNTPENQFSYYYNHRTNQVEVWQMTYDKNTRKSDFKKIR